MKKLKNLAREEIKHLGLSRFFPRRSKKIDKPAGTVQYVGEEKTEKVSINVIDYSKTDYSFKESVQVGDLKAFSKSKTSSWINIDGIHDTSVVEKIGEIFEIHPLVLEDIANVNQRPKIELYENFIFVVLKMLTLNEETKDIKSEQVSLILGKNFLITFQEGRGDIFDSIRERIKNPKSRARKFGNDYLMYSLIDTIVDSYFVILEKLGEHIEDLEEEVLLHPRPETQMKIYSLKRELILLRKSVWPLREIIGSISREESKIISRSISVYFRDVYDHTIQVIDTVETFRDLLSGMIDSYLSASSNKMNEIMKVLTIMSTIFIPLTFLVGVYGMNFRYLPELEIWWFYPALWGVMILIAGGMLFFFKRKKWI